MKSRKAKYRRVRVTLEVPRNYIPKDAKDPEEVFAALITAALIEFRVRVVQVNKRDLVR